MGFFGFTLTRTVTNGKPAVSAQPRFKAVVNLEEAHARVADITSVWREVARWGDAAPFSGGVFDAWPRRIAQGLAFLRGESKAVESYLMHLEAKP